MDSESDDAPLTQEPNDGWWRMNFDGATSKKGVGVDISIRPPVGEPKLLS